MHREPGTQRVGRLFEIYLLIAAQPRCWTRARLTDRYEVSERQIQQDIDELRHRLRADIRRTREGYYFESQPVLPPLRLELTEALALLRAARAGGRLTGVHAADLAAALARLETALPAEVAGLLPGVESPSSEPAARHRQAILAELELALARRRRVRLTYRAASRDGAAAERLVDAYAVAPYGRGWYLIGYCHLRRAVRTFKIDRIAAVAATEERYAVPADFDAAAYLGDGAAWGVIADETGLPEDVVLQFSPLAGRWVREEQWHPSQQVEEATDGAILLYLRVVVTPEFRRWVFHYGREVAVIAPPSLRAWIADEAWAVAATSGPEPTARPVAPPPGVTNGEAASDAAARDRRAGP
ncbi:MAG: WYL domain-containing protein [Chloroflexi bacterium]|nr:WYL domain-containing protein [Chloroflexota bacterium]